MICATLAFLPNNLSLSGSSCLSTIGDPHQRRGLAARGTARTGTPIPARPVYAGYLVHLYGINSSLFDGSPSQSTAYFTFSTDVLQVTPIPNNGNMALSLISAGTFNVYYSTNPNGDCRRPSHFCKRQAGSHLHQGREPVPW